MKRINKYLLILIILFLVTRLINLTVLPPFNDESIYTEFGVRMIDNGNYFYSLYDGKQPFLMWFFGAASFLTHDPILGARLISVLAGFGSLMGLYLIAKENINKKSAFIVGLIYIFTPLFLFYDRQALMESSVTAIGIWNFYFLLKLLKDKKSFASFYIGLIWGIGLFTKSSVLVFVLSTFVVAFIQAKQRARTLKPISISLLVALVFLSILLLQKDFVKIITLNSRYTFTFIELFSFPFGSWLKNFISLFDISLTQVFGLCLFSIPVLFIRVFKEKKDSFYKTLFTWIAVGVLSYVFLSKTPSARYLVTFLGLGSLLIVENITNLTPFNLFKLAPTSVWFILLIILEVFAPIKYFSLLSRVSTYSQREAYVDNFTSGYASLNAITYLMNKIGNSKAVVGVRLDSGNPENMTFLYFKKLPNTTTVFMDSRIVDLPKNKNYIQSDRPIYFISRENELAGMDKFLILDRFFYSPDSQSKVGVYKVRLSP